jgi:hypothetical protein
MGDSGQYPRVLSIGNDAENDFDSPLTTIPFARGGPGVSALRVIRNNTGVSASFPAYNTPFLAVSAQYANTQEISVNGATPTTTTTNTSAAFSTTTYGLGIQNNITGSGEQTLVGYICELIVFNTYLTTSQRQQVEGYLAHKWGLTSRFSTPLTIPGCAMWLDGADPVGTGTPPVSGTTISTWVDKSGNSNNGTSGTAAFQTDALGGYINFTGSQSYVITNPNIVVNQYFTIFIVEQIGNVPLSQDYVLMKGSTNDNNRNLHIVYRGGSPVIAFAFYFNDLNVNVSSYGYGTGNTQPTRLWTFSFIANSRNIYLNGTSIASDNNNTFLSSWTGARIGSHPSPSDHYIGKIRELMIYSGTVNTTQRQTIEGYLSQKWGLGVSSTNPSTHPFYRFPPATLPFSPRNISGLQLWLDAADSSTVTGTTSVTQWRDKSGNDRHLGVGSGTTSYSSSAIVLNSSYMFVNSPVNLTNVTVFIVSKSTGVTNQTILGAKPNTDYVYNSVDGFGFYNDPPTGRIRFYGQGDDPRQSIFFTDTSITKLYTFQSTGTTVSGWLNGTSQSGGTLTTTRTSTAQGFAIGAEWGGSSYVNIWVTASIYEILVYNTALTTSQRQQVEGYLAQKWGLTGSLPSSHPFKKLPA